MLPVQVGFRGFIAGCESNGNPKMGIQRKALQQVLSDPIKSAVMCTVYSLLCPLLFIVDVGVCGCVCVCVFSIFYLSLIFSNIVLDKLKLCLNAV